MKNRDFVTSYGLFCTIIISVVGVGIFSYPGELTSAVENNGWILTLISGFIAYGLAYIIYKSVQINNFDKFHTIMKNNFGKILGVVFTIIFAGYTTFFIALGMRDFVEVIKMYLLEKTPTEILLVVTILAGSYLVRGEIGSLIKFNEVAFWIMFLPMILILILTLNNIDFTNIFPLLSTKPMNYAKGLSAAAYSFAGFQIIYLVLPFVKNKIGMSKTLFKSMGFITIFYIIIVMFCISVFSINQTKVLLWPTITMIKSINIPGAFIERWEGVVMTMWIVFYFTNFVNLYYFSSDLIKDIFGLKDIKLGIAIVTPFIYITAMYPDNVADLFDISRLNSIIYNLYSLVIIPLMLFLVHKLRKRKSKEVI